ncbi:hypothetical protein PG999_010528 [Apiospora kogelbergensis]|uniref:Uncharacterized protein n=1 Tax=Apiospora kogelbergensis TaxID=1337665 RepID=A0AAW0QKA4_9PEZI
MGAGTCYFPNQLEASGNFPCNNNSASGSACCGGGLGTVCLENGLCQLPQGNVVRGACTDDKWGDGCPQYCLGATTGGTDLISCKSETGDETLYCCDHQPNCCKSGAGRFSVLPAQPKAAATWNRQASRFDQVPKPTSSSATPSSSASGLTTTTAAPQSSTDATQPTAKPEAAGSGGLSSGASVGIGVGVGLGAAVILAVVAFLLWRRHRRNKSVGLADDQRGGPSAGPAGPPNEVEGSAQYKAPAEYSPNGPYSEVDGAGARHKTPRGLLWATAGAAFNDNTPSGAAH